MWFIKDLVKLYTDYRDYYRDYSRALKIFNRTINTRYPEHYNCRSTIKPIIEDELDKLTPHKRKRKTSLLIKIRRFMKKLIKNVKRKMKKMKKIFKKKSKRTRKPSAKTTTNKRKKTMAVVKIELSDDVKQVAAKLRELANALDPVETQAAETAAPKKGKKTVDSKKVKSKSIEIEEESPFADDKEESFEDEETFEDDESFEDEETEESLSIEEDIIPACKAYTKKYGPEGRKKLAAILKSFKAKSVHDLKESDYEKFLKKIK